MNKRYEDILICIQPETNIINSKLIEYFNRLASANTGDRVYLNWFGEDEDEAVILASLLTREELININITAVCPECKINKSIQPKRYTPSETWLLSCKCNKEVSIKDALISWVKN